MAIDLQAKSVSDSQKIHNNQLGTGGFAIDMTFTDPGNPETSQTIKCLYNDTSLAVNPETGLVVIGSKVAISFHQSDLSIWDGLTDLQRWKVEFINGAGQDITAELFNIIPDRSLGDVLCICKIVLGHR